MGFEEFGIVSFTNAGKTEQFVEFLKNNEICGTVCRSCGAKFFPPRSDCFQCLSDDMDWFPINGEGILMTYTTVMFAPAGFEKDAPYTVGVAEFSDGIKVFGRFAGSFSGDAVKVGMKVKIRTVFLEGGRVSYELTEA